MHWNRPLPSAPHARLATLLSLALAAPLVSCKDEAAPSAGSSASASASAAAPAAAPAAAVLPFDAEARKARLQGKWRAGPADRPHFELEIKGDQIRLQHLRYTEKTEEGELLLPTATTLWVKKPDGMKHGYTIAEIDGALHFGMGGAHYVPDLENFTIELGLFEEKLVRTKDSCVWSKNFGEKQEKAVACSVVEEEGRKRLRYQEGDGDELKNRELLVAGNMVMSEDVFTGKLESIQ